MRKKSFWFQILKAKKQCVQTVEWKVLELKVLFQLGQKAQQQQKRRQRKEAKLFFFAFLSSHFGEKAFNIIHSANKTQYNQQELSSMASIYTLQGVPKILAHKALKQAIRSILKHTKDFPLLLCSIMLLLPFARSFSEDLPQKKPRHFQRIL